MSRSKRELVFKIGDHTFEIWTQPKLGDEFGVKVKVENCEPFWLEENNTWETHGGCMYAILRYLEEAS